MNERYRRICSHPLSTPGKKVCPNRANTGDNGAYCAPMWVKLLRRGSPVAFGLGALVMLGLLLALPSAHAHADTSHTVRAGQNLASIARAHDVTVWSLAARNGLSPDAQVRPGQVLELPEKGVVYVNPGQTLWSVARRHNCSVETLARENGLTTSTSLRPGMRLRLPGAPPSAAKAKTAAKGGRATDEKATQDSERGDLERRRKQGGGRGSSGRVELYRVATQQRIVLSLVDPRGRVRPHAVRKLQDFLRPRNSMRTKPPHRRLVGLLAEVSDHFNGRKISVVSGYRLAKGYTSHQSRHVAGAAIDLHVEGIANRKLCDYLRHFDNVGVGFYPNSTFVHFDVRDRNAYWIDVSGPGQKPLYLTKEARDTYTGNRSEGLAELGASVGAALEDLMHGEPSAAESDDE